MSADPAVARILDEAPARRFILNTGTPDEVEANAVAEAERRYELLRSRLLTPNELEAMPPPEPLIEGYCSLDTIMTTFGRPGTAKTLIAMSMAFSISSGESWFGHEVKQGPALYIAAEGLAGLGQRQRAWREICGYPSLDRMHWLPMTVNLLDTTWVSALVRVVEDIAPLFVVIDTVARSMPGGDENSSTDMSALVSAADRIREVSGATVNLVHHTPKEGSTPRGHSALEGAVDSALLLERNGNLVTLTTYKQKDLPTPDPVVFELTPIDVSVTLTLPKITATSFEIVGAEKTLRDLVWQSSGSDGLSPSALLRMSEMTERSFYRALKTLRERGIVRNVGSDTRPRYVGADESLPILPNTAMAASKTLTAKSPPLGAWQYGSDCDSDSDLQALDFEDEEPI